MKYKIIIEGKSLEEIVDKLESYRNQYTTLIHTLTGVPEKDYLPKAEKKRRKRRTNAMPFKKWTPHEDELVKEGFRDRVNWRKSRKILSEQLGRTISAVEGRTWYLGLHAK